MTTSSKAKTAIVIGGAVFATLGAGAQSQMQQAPSKNVDASTNNVDKVIKTAAKKKISRPKATKDTQSKGQKDIVVNKDKLNNNKNAPKIETLSVSRQDDLNNQLKLINEQITKVDKSLSQEKQTQSITAQNVFMALNDSPDELNTEVKNHIDNGLTSDDMKQVTSIIHENESKMSKQNTSDGQAILQRNISKDNSDNVIKNLNLMQASFSNMNDLNANKKILLQQKNEILKLLNKQQDNSKVDDKSDQLKQLNEITNSVMKTIEAQNANKNNVVQNLNNHDDSQDPTISHDNNVTNNDGQQSNNSNQNTNNNDSQSSSAPSNNGQSSNAPSQSAPSSSTPSDSPSSSTPNETPSSSVPSDSPSSSAPSDNGHSSGNTTNDGEQSSSAPSSSTPSDSPSSSVPSDSGNNNGGQSSSNPSNPGGNNNNNNNGDVVSVGGTLNYVKSHALWNNKMNLADSTKWNGNYLPGKLQVLQDNQMSSYRPLFTISDDGFEGNNTQPNWSKNDVIRNGVMTSSQYAEFNQYMMMLLNQYRSQYGTFQLQSSGSVQSATIVRGQSLMQGSTTHNTNAMHNAFSQFGLPDPAECLAPVDITVGQGFRKGDPTMLELMQSAADSLNQLLNADGDSNYGHRKILLSKNINGFVSQNGAFSAQYNHSNGSYNLNFNAIN